MQLGMIALKIRAGETDTFGNRVLGAADFAGAMDKTFRVNTAFVVPLTQSCEANQHDGGIVQEVVERFGVVVALANDSTKTDKTGLTAYDRLDDIRAELFSNLLGWYIDGAKSDVYYRGARLLDMNSANLWYMFEFEYTIQITEDDGAKPEATDVLRTMYAQIIAGEDPLNPLPDGLPSPLVPPTLDTLIVSDHAFGAGFNDEFNSLEDVKNKANT